jgi:hypothetical protein
LVCVSCSPTLPYSDAWRTSARILRCCRRHRLLPGRDEREAKEADPDTVPLVVPFPAPMEEEEEEPPRKEPYFFMPRKLRRFFSLCSLPSSCGGGSGAAPPLP